MKRPQPAAAEVADDGILQQIEAKATAEIELEPSTVREEEILERTLFRS